MRMLRKVDLALAWLGAAAAIAMMLHVAADVFARNVLGLALPATLEIVSGYYMPAIIFLPLAFVERQREHIEVSFIFDILPAWLQRVLTPATLAVVAIVYCAIGWVALEEAVAKYKIGEFLMGTTPVLMWPGRFFGPIGFFALSALVTLKLAIILIWGAQTAAPDAQDSFHE